MDAVADVTREALDKLRAAYYWNMQCLGATDAERELARLKVGLIDTAIAAM